MEQPRYVMVVNPQAQGGSLGRRWPDLSKSLRRQLGSFEEVHTEAPGDATRLTREALRHGADRVVAIGGDGTINEVVNGFFEDGTRIGEGSLGILPFGSGGDFRKSIHVPKDHEAAAARLASGHPRLIDVGKVEYTTSKGATNCRYFVNIASFGISGLVDQYVNDSTKKLGGTVAFLMASARAGLSYSNQRVRLTFDDDAPIDTTIQVCAVANGRYFGGGMYIAPEASLDDGKFDVVAIGDVSRAKMLLSGYRIYNGTHLTLDEVTHRRASSVRAEPLGNEPVLLDVDGETPGRLPATFSLLPAAISVIVP